MKVQLAFLFTLVASLVAAWSVTDYELFELNDVVKRDLGPETTFYSWLGLEKGPKSLWDEINKAYKKLSRKIHPDKIRKAEQRYLRLSVVGSILRDAEQRERYNYFLDKGFPKKTTTGYLYSKFRPGTMLVFVLLYAVFGGFQYMSLKINRQQDQKRMRSMIQQLKQAAWPNGIPTDFSDRKVGSEADGKTFIIKYDGSVYLLDPEDSSTQYLLDPESIGPPSWRDTIWCTFPRWVWNFTAGRVNQSWKLQPREENSTGMTPQEAKIVELESTMNANEDAKERRKNKMTDGVRRLPNGKIVGTKKE
ncbi:hypothetical protein BABINDRAFT_34690 [Babjeviella inositovora NRRL Y-12698]|uniref:J domain-containing protein n=1 Tax=Babjeviella inositovora NRRL Y-12698 TaxID=984486 RepID=A0A1E3QU92_9ASCO|nr:uncharacterized protein BABINDRAFT_34690 [Babjeviella inositovora NRRL Y-12698]ODQ80507.1 hypothetical protein BABINDRAFT_34690 [Babjeviella inositovora NRRL Y-12698]